MISSKLRLKHSMIRPLISGHENSERISIDGAKMVAGRVDTKPAEAIP